MFSSASVAVNRPSGGIQRLVTSVPKGVWVFADQAIASLANFTTTVFVGRCAGQEQLGFYILAYSLYLTALGLAKAMVWTPYTKQANHLEDQNRSTFAGSSTVHLGFFVLLVIATILTIALVVYLGTSFSSLGKLLLVLGPCGALMLVREHVRRLCLASLATIEVCLFDLMVVTVQISALAWLASRGQISAITAFLAVGFACLLSFVWLCYRRDQIVFQRNRFWPDWLLNWDLSKWLTGGAFSVLIGRQGYSWLLPAMTSMTELGKLGSAQGVIQIANPLVLGVANYLGPVSARIHAKQGIRGLYRCTLQSTLMIGIFAILLLVVVGIFGETIVQLVYADAAKGVDRLILLTLGLGLMTEVLIVPVEFASVNRGRGRLMLYSALLRLAINLTIGVFLVWLYGVVGIGIGITIGCVLAMAWHWYVLRGDVKNV